MDGVPLVDHVRGYTGELWVLAARVVLVFTDSRRRRACRLAYIHIWARFAPNCVANTHWEVSLQSPSTPYSDTCQPLRSVFLSDLADFP